MPNADEVIALVDRILLAELAGVVSHTHASLAVSGVGHESVAQAMREQADISLRHAREAGAILARLGGTPTLGIADLPTGQLDIVPTVLFGAIQAERRTEYLYSELLDASAEHPVYLEAFARSQMSAQQRRGATMRELLTEHEAR